MTGIEYKATQTLEDGLTTTDTVNKDGVPGTWVFSGWYDNENCEGDPITDIKNITEDQDVYGKWEFVPTKYTLTYEVVGDKPSDGKTDKTPDQVTDIPYNTVQDIENGLTTRDGQKDGVPGKWTFKGWYDNPGLV